MSSLDRLLRPKSIAVVGGGTWCANVVRECQKIGFEGPVWPVHPSRAEIAGVPAFASLDALPDAPDACFLGINREASVSALSGLAEINAGGAVCFAAGFSEAAAELSDGLDLQGALVAAAGEMPFLGPNCYGFVNALDGAALWPDQHGLVRVDSGVAILTQSSNVALNLTMQRRGLPIAYLGTVGNQARVDLAGLGEAVLDDPRVTALGLYIEGISDVRAFERLAARARSLGKRIVAMKLGASEQSVRAAVSHTASLTGSDAGARALLRRLGIAQVSSLSAFLETLKILHGYGPLPSNRLASMSCSGGEASLVADSALAFDVAFPDLIEEQKTGLRVALGEKVALANPLDYNTYIWGDVAAMRNCFAAMMRGDVAMGLVVLDFPRPDRCGLDDWLPVLDAMERARALCGKPLAVLATLVDTLPEDMAAACEARGLLALCDLPAALEALAAAAFLGREVSAKPVLLAEDSAGLPALLSEKERTCATLTEDSAKDALARVGVRVPKRGSVSSPDAGANAAEDIGFPVVLKGLGHAHKSEAGAVRLNLTSPEEVRTAADEMTAERFLVEEMVTGGVAEVLLGILHDAAHGFVLTIGAGGIMTEVLQDTVSLMVPVDEAEFREGLNGLRMAPVLSGWRGAPAVDITAVWDAVDRLQTFVMHEARFVEEVEVNPLICRENDAIAVDALIRLRADET